MWADRGLTFDKHVIKDICKKADNKIEYLTGMSNILNPF